VFRVMPRQCHLAQCIGGASAGSWNGHAISSVTAKPLLGYSPAIIAHHSGNSYCPQSLH